MRLHLIPWGPLSLYTPEELADFLGLRVETLCAWRRCGAGPMYIEYKTIDVVFYRAGDINEWVLRQIRARLFPHNSQDSAA